MTVMQCLKGIAMPSVRGATPSVGCIVSEGEGCGSGCEPRSGRSSGVGGIAIAVAGTATAPIAEEGGVGAKRCAGGTVASGAEILVDGAPGCKTLSWKGVGRPGEVAAGRRSFVVVISSEDAVATVWC